MVGLKEQVCAGLGRQAGAGGVGLVEERGRREGGANRLGRWGCTGQRHLGQAGTGKGPVRIPDPQLDPGGPGGGKGVGNGRGGSSPYPRAAGGGVGRGALS